jgi:hypothetical protein
MHAQTFPANKTYLRQISRAFYHPIILYVLFYVKASLTIFPEVGMGPYCSLDSSVGELYRRREKGKFR